MFIINIKLALLNSESTFMNKTLLALSISAAALTLVSCGGSSNGSSSNTTVSGKVLDGYIANAKVCLDSNKNYQCDAGEPYTISDATGAYTLSFGGTATNQIILAQVFENASDADDAGKSLSDAHRVGFTLAAPAVQASVISPLTTLVTLDLLSSLNAPITDAAILASETKVKTKLNNSDAIMGADFVKSGNQNLHQLASVITAALSEVDVIADTAVRGVAAETVTDSTVLQQTVYQAMSDGVYAALAVVVNTTNHDALINPSLSASRSNVVTAVDFLKVTGTGAATTLYLKIPDRAYLDDTSFHDAACSPELSDLACFVQQEFLN